MKGGEPFDVGLALELGQWGTWQKLIVALVASAIVLDGFDNQVLGFVVPALLREWSVTRDALAPVFALSSVGMVIGTILGGAVGDRLGRRPALIGAVALFGVVTGITGLANSIEALALGRAIAGFGLGAAMPNAATLLAEFAPANRRSLAVTLGIVCIPLGGVIGGLVAAPILPTIGWRALFAIGGVAPLLVALLLFLLLPESPRFLVGRVGVEHHLSAIVRRLGYTVDANQGFIDSHRTIRTRASINELFGQEYRFDTAALWIAFFACLLTTYVVFNWGPTLLAQAGYDLAFSSVGLAVFNTGGVAGAIAAAACVPKFGSRTVMMITAAGGVLGALALAGLTGGAAEGILLVALGIEGAFVNAVQTSLYALAASIYPTGMRATGVGSAAGFGRIGAIVSSFAGAAILAGGWGSYFLLLGIGMIVTFAAIAVIRRHVRPVGPVADSLEAFA